PAAPAPQESLIHPLLMRNGDSRPLTKPTTPLPSLDLLTPPPSQPAAPAPQESLIHPLLMRNGDSRPLTKPTTPLP
ncbi:hypothetical protein CQA77_30245, partial [Klebsiella pneumoniae]